MKVKIVSFFVALGICAQANALTVEWGAGGFNYLYDSTGAQILTDGLLIQLIIDVGNNTDVGLMISSGQLGIGSESELGGVNPSANASDDIIGTWNDGLWTFSSYAHFADPVVSDVSGNPTRLFYFRWFNAADQGTATEAGFIFNSIDGWVTAATDGDTQPVLSFNYGTANVTGSEDTAGANPGWATVAPVPEPTTMALMGLGLVAVAARRRFAKKA